MSTKFATLLGGAALVIALAGCAGPTPAPTDAGGTTEPPTPTPTEATGPLTQSSYPIGA